MGPLCLIYKVTTSVHIVDVHTMKTFEIDGATYWNHPFQALCSKDRLSEFVIIDVDQDKEFQCNTNMSRAAAKQKFSMIEVEAARSKDFGQSDATFHIQTHLGNQLSFNDYALGYDLERLNLVDLERLENTKKARVPVAVLVRKHFPKYRKRQKQRAWKLKHLTKQEGLTEQEDGPQKKKKSKIDKRGAHLEAEKRRDYE